MIAFNKSEVKEFLSIENIFDLLSEWGGNPEYTDFGILSHTICHNRPGEGSKKLYYYSNTALFRCYTSCDSTFDIFELAIKVADIQNGKLLDLNDAVRYVAFKIGYCGKEELAEEEDSLLDWKLLSNYERIEEINPNTSSCIILKEYDKEILNKFNYNIKITPWIKEGITQEVLEKNNIGYFPGGDQITIPHFDKNSRFVGLRGRTVCQEEGEKFGKYRPIKIFKDIYNHPLGMNLYNLNNSQYNIAKMNKAIIFEGEKSVLKYQSYFGTDNDISVACCGSSVTNFQIQQLIDCGAQEIIIAFDRQFQEIGDEDFMKLKKNLIKIHSKYKNFVRISFIFDKKKITDYKSAPIDHGRDTFLKLFKERILL